MKFSKFKNPQSSGSGHRFHQPFLPDFLVTKKSLEKLDGTDQTWPIGWTKNSEAFHRDIKGPNILLDKNGGTRGSERHSWDWMVVNLRIRLHVLGELCWHCMKSPIQKTGVVRESLSKMAWIQVDEIWKLLKPAINSKCSYLAISLRCLGSS